MKNLFFRLFIFVALVYSFLPVLHAKSKVDFSTKGVLGALKKEVGQLSKKGIIDIAIPSFKEDEWKIHVLAEEEAISDKIEVSGKSLIYIGNKMFTEKLVIHGDGILFINGDLVCPEIDIKGNAIVVYNENKVKYYGGLLKIGSGLIVARNSNSLNVHMRNNGIFYVGGNNNGKVSANGQVTVYIKGKQQGDIKIGKGNNRPAKVFVGNKMVGKLDVQQHADVEIKSSLEGDVRVVGNLKIKSGDFLYSNMNVSGAMNGVMASIVSGEETSLVNVGSGSLKVVKSAMANLTSVGHFNYIVGDNQKGFLTTLKGNLTASIANACEGDVNCGASATFNTGSYLGKFSAKHNAIINAKTVFESYLLKTGGNCKLKATTFKGNAEIAKSGDLTAANFLSDKFYHYMHLGQGSVKAGMNNELEVIIKGNGLVSVGANNQQLIKIGQNGTVKIGSNNKGRIIVGANGTISVKRDQADTVFVGQDGTVSLGKAFKSVVVVRSAKMSIGETQKSYFDKSILKMGYGSINVKRNNNFDVIATDKAQAANLSVGLAHKGDITLAGKGNIKILRDSVAEVFVGNVASFQAENQTGKMHFANMLTCVISGTLMGDLYVAENPGKSSLKIGHILDSNIGIYAFANIWTDEIKDIKAGAEKVYLKTGSLIAKLNIEADFLGKHDIHVQAKNIYGNVDIGDESSKVDAIVKGKMKVGL